MNEGYKNLRTLVIRDEVKATAFSFYTAEEVKKISVKRILTTASLDVLGNPIPGGLYDPAMGPLNRFETYFAPAPRHQIFIRFLRFL
jgi:DNA-directed RNA polymerase I subunit RPA1